jgi:hypothetical protein
MKLHFYKRTENQIDLNEMSDMFTLSGYRGLVGKRSTQFRFDNSDVDFSPGSAFSITPDKFRTEANSFLAKAIRVVLESTPHAVTVLVNGDYLVLKRKPGEKTATVHYNYCGWDMDSLRLLESEAP